MILIMKINIIFICFFIVFMLISCTEKSVDVSEKIAVISADEEQILTGQTRIIKVGDIIYSQKDENIELKYIYSGRTVENILWIFKHSYIWKDDIDNIKTIEAPLRTERGDNGVYLSLAGNYIVYISAIDDEQAKMKVVSDMNELAKIQNVNYNIGEIYNVNIGENIHSVIRDEYALIFTYCGITKDNEIWILKQKYYYGADIVDSDIETIMLSVKEAEKMKLTDDYFVSINVGDLQRLTVEVILPI